MALPRLAYTEWPKKVFFNRCVLSNNGERPISLGKLELGEYSGVSTRSLFGFDRTGDWHCMKDDQQRFLSLLGQLPVRLTAEETGWVLNCQAHDIPALINARLLKPLGNPAQNGAKYFATADVLETAKDRAWLVKMSNTISQHWQRQNGCKRNGATKNHVSEFELSAVASR
jgi:hypothetical protein